MHEIWQFFRLTSYFCKYVKTFTITVRPLTQLTKKNTKFIWEDQQQQAFTYVKVILSTRPVLALYHPKYKTEHNTDVSKYGNACILLQQ